MIGIFITWEKLFFTLTFTYNYSYPFEKVRFPFEHFWSLCVEEHFYIVFPMLLYFLTIRNAQNFIQFFIPIFCVTAAFMTYLIFEKDIADKMVFSSSYCRIISLSFGAMFAFKENQIDEKVFSFKQYLSIISFMGVLYVLGIESEHLSKYLPPPMIRLIAFSIFSSLFFLIVLKLKNKESGLEKVFTNPIITYIGVISYGLYMYHYPIIFIVSQKYRDYVGIVNIQDAIVILLTSFVISIFSYKSFERPILRMKRVKQY
jgi:peptidoglycan/LPS O-acetylase OafA/YrhL